MKLVTRINSDGIEVKFYLGEGATVGDRAKVGEGATVGAWATVGEGATVGDRARVGEEATVGEGATVLAGIKIPLGLNGVTFNGLQFVATVNDDRIAIGCEVKTITEWLMVDVRMAVKLGLRKELYPLYRAFVEMVANYQKPKTKQTIAEHKSRKPAAKRTKK